MPQVKYRHPANNELTWSGKGRQPKWVEAYVANGGTLVELENPIQQAESGGGEIDLGIGDAPVIDTETANQNIRLDELNERINPLLITNQPEAGQQQLEVCLREFGFPALTAEEFIQAGADEFNKSIVHACRAGAAFWAAQEALKNKSDRADLARTTGMDELIAEIGLPKQRVYEAISMAKFYSRLPESKRPQALSLGKRNALLLASLPQEVIDQAAESGNDLIEKADLMTVSELKEEIRSLKRREKNYEAELERSQSQVKRLSDAKKRTTEFLIRTEDIREECMALQLGVELHLNSLKKLFEDTDPQAPEGVLQQEHLWIAAHAAAARAFDLIEFMQARAAEGMPDRPMTRHLLTTEEAVRWMSDYPLIENRYAAEAAVRETKREAARPRGVGRPKGSGNKGAEE